MHHVFSSQNRQQRVQNFRQEIILNFFLHIAAILLYKKVVYSVFKILYNVRFLKKVENVAYSGLKLTLEDKYIQTIPQSLIFHYKNVKSKYNAITFGSIIVILVI